MIRTDHSRDWMIWNDTETVTLQSTRLTGSMLDSLTVMRSELDAAERAASGAVYIGADVNFLLPTMLLAPGFIPKPGDVVIDADGNRYTALRVAGQVRDTQGFQVYKLSTRNLSIAYDLQHLITIETPSNLGVQDATGAKAPKQWAAKYTQLAARVQPLDSSIVDERGIRGFKITHNIYLSQEVSVTNEDRVNWSGKLYEIRGYHQSERVDELPYLEAELLP